MIQRKNCRFQTFYKALFSFSKIALQNIFSIQKNIVNRVHIYNGGYSIGSVLRDYYYVNNDKMRDIPEYEICVNFLKCNKDLEKHRESVIGKNLKERDLVRAIESKYLRPFIEKLAEKTHLNFNQHVFDKLYEKLETFLCEPGEKYVQIYPLPHFHSEVDEFKLSKGLKIRKISINEKKQIFHDIESYIAIFYPNIVGLIAQSNFIIEYVWSPVSGRPIASINQAVLAFSLYKSKSHVDHHGSINYRVSWFKGFQGFSSPPFLSDSKHYELDKKEVGNFLDFWKYEYLPVIDRENHFMNIAISRFDDFRHNKSWSYGLIDLIISLEAMYLTRERGKANNLSRRCAALLGLEKDRKEKEKIRNYIKVAYKLRNDMVHGGMPNWKKISKIDSDITPYDFVYEIFEYTRKSILMFLSINKKDELINKRNKYRNLISLIDEVYSNDEKLKKYLRCVND